MPVQRSLRVSDPHDCLEQEADRVASSVASGAKWLSAIRRIPDAAYGVQRSARQAINYLAQQDVRHVYQDFVNNAEKYGLPVKFLRRVGRDYAIEAGGDIDSTNTLLNTIQFTTGTLEDIKDLTPGLPFRLSGIQTVYHEATHAYLDLVKQDPKVEAFIRAGETHYKDAPVKGGRTVTSDPARVFQEAAASYVGHRAATWWTTFQKLNLWAALGKLGPQQVGEFRKEYDGEMSVRKFGYSQEGGFLGIGAEQAETDRPISAEMKTFLDRELLEDKIPEHFDEAPGFARIIASASPPQGPADIQKKQADTEADAPNVERAVAVGLGSDGRLLPTSAADFFGDHLSYDFSRVRIHTDGRAALSAHTLGARAYTTGDHVVFAHGEYAPETAKGVKLLAHELTHIVQQNSS